MKDMWFITVHSKSWQSPRGEYFVFDVHPYNAKFQNAMYGNHNHNVGYWKRGSTNDPLQNHTRITGTEFREIYLIPQPIQKLLDF